MTHVDQYDYELPKELIAQEPLRNRSDARLMVIDRQSGSIEHHHIRDLPDLVRPGDAMVLNNTRVLPAKLVGYRTTTRGRWTGLFLDADELGVAKVLAKTRGKVQPGDTVTLQTRNGVDDVRLMLLARLSGGAWAVRPEKPEPWVDVLERVGQVPLPHYIRGGHMSDHDLDTYQTVFAKQPGAVAAPTAGLHFTKDMLIYLNDFGVELCTVTLHVGVGTFRPIGTEQIEDHQMHTERAQISEETVNRLKLARSTGNRVIAVGTTSVRTLESASQNGELEPWEGETDLFIHPPYRFRSVDALLTNFHLPRSTLLVLIRTFGGNELMKRAYELAIEEKYRFYSYGDAMLIL
ncbi:MAG: tRNA preQ1(34) S-adenosylmethionine ribosyltransferase-isomerase QueA [Planctomycetota bacterium]|jgi:S-adenosylmethionine:tRNA ribosyltransferase-isomerase|nr:tRNA preQ1(34) S-adenosylmethionine ribosyltransferase-isomerase QueA [Planctomycetota bacterium]